MEHLCRQKHSPLFDIGTIKYPDYGEGDNDDEDARDVRIANFRVDKGVENNI